MGPKANTPAVGALARTQQAAVKSKLDDLAKQIKERCDRLKVITEAGEELDSDDAELLSVALDGDDMCKAWVNSVRDKFIKKGGLTNKSYAFQATRKANGEFKDHYSFPTQAAEKKAEKRGEDNRPVHHQRGGSHPQITGARFRRKRKYRRSPRQMTRLQRRRRQTKPSA